MFPFHMYIMYLYVHTVYTPTLALEHAHTQFPSLTHILSLPLPSLPPSLLLVELCHAAASDSQQRMHSNKRLLQELNRLRETQHTQIEYYTRGMNVAEAVT